ncbi:MAG: hypothetical protein IPL23_31360 [Saprospiraceae bacterium]|nr:hypothetical protein [Saprospiraceae bacterium]
MNYKLNSRINNAKCAVKRELDQLQLYLVLKERFVTENVTPGQLSLFEDLSWAKGRLKSRQKRSSVTKGKNLVRNTKDATRFRSSTGHRSYN